MKTMLIIFLILPYSIIMNGQNNTIKGTVSDIETHETLPGAGVSVEPDLSKFKELTDINGAFLISGLPDGKFVFRVTYFAYKIYTDTIIFSKNNREIVKNINLEAVFPPPIMYTDTVLTGKYVDSFEYDGIKPCGTNENWWVKEAPEAFRRKYVSFRPITLNYEIYEVFVSIKCRVSTPGKFGHLGMYKYEVIIEELIDMKLWKPEYCN